MDHTSQFFMTGLLIIWRYLGLTEDVETVGDAKTNRPTDGSRTNTGVGLSNRKWCSNPQVHPDSGRKEKKSLDRSLSGVKARPATKSAYK
jgi:hypothetical protein